MSNLTQTEVEKRLTGLGGWQLEGKAITKQYTFKDFCQAMDFINRLAVVADKELNHHPEWSNVYNRVTISLTTHDAGGLTEKDFQLAQAAEKIAADLPN